MFKPLAAILALSLVSFAQAAEGGAATEMEFFTRVSVDAAGKVTGTEFIRPVPAGLQKLVADTAATVAFEPATRDGVPVPSRTALQLRMRFTPDGGDYRVELLSVDGNGAATAEARLPRVPASVMRRRYNLLAVAEVQVRADGSVDTDASQVVRIEFYSGNERSSDAPAHVQRDMREAMLAAMKEWTFVPEEVDGVAIPARLSVPVTLCIVRRGDGKASCDAWSQKVSSQLGRPEPADAGLRLAQLRTQDGVVPDA